METVISARGSRRLARRAPIAVDPTRAVAIKRDVHEYVVQAPAAELALALRAVVTDPASRFGLIRIKRPEERMGAPFEVGERFQGCFAIERAVPGWLGPVVRWRPIAWVVARVEDLFLSNYAEIEAIDFTPAPGEPYVLRYGYLKGTPIAGSTTLLLQPLGPSRTRFVQVFEYQETDAMSVMTFQQFGLKFHDQVVHEEVRQAARRCGAVIESGTIPTAYALLAGAGMAA